jgi:hypothetical protein
MSNENNPGAPVMRAAKVIEIKPHPGGMFQINSSDAREVFRITSDGQVIINPEFTVDEAAREFWDAVRNLAGKEPIR